MPPSKLPTSVLLALGLAASCGKNGETDTETGVGPCLQPPPDSGDSGARLDCEPGGDDLPTDAPGRRQARASPEAADAVLDRGVLPDDVAALLRSRRNT